MSTSLPPFPATPPHDASQLTWAEFFVAYHQVVIARFIAAGHVDTFSLRAARTDLEISQDMVVRAKADPEHARFPRLPDQGGYVIPTAETCNFRDDMRGMEYAWWCHYLGVPVGVPISPKAARLLADAYAFQCRDGGAVHDGQCGDLVKQALEILSEHAMDAAPRAAA